MKSFCDLSWLEKCDIRNGRVNPYSYSTGYTFDVKSKVREGQEKAEKQKEKKEDK